MQGIMEFAAYVVEVLLATPDFGSICGLHGDWRMALQAGGKESFVLHTLPPPTFFFVGEIARCISSSRNSNPSTSINLFFLDCDGSVPIGRSDPIQCNSHDDFPHEEIIMAPRSVRRMARLFSSSHKSILLSISRSLIQGRIPSPTTIRK